MLRMRTIVRCTGGLGDFADKLLLFGATDRKARFFKTSIAKIKNAIGSLPCKVLHVRLDNPGLTTEKTKNARHTLLGTPLHRPCSKTGGRDPFNENIWTERIV
jgi:hypothetical protein